MIVIIEQAVVRFITLSPWSYIPLDFGTILLNLVGFNFTILFLITINGLSVAGMLIFFASAMRRYQLRELHLQNIVRSSRSVWL